MTGREVADGPAGWRLSDPASSTLGLWGQPGPPTPSAGWD